MKEVKARLLLLEEAKRSVKPRILNKKLPVDRKHGHSQHNDFITVAPQHEKSFTVLYQQYTEPAMCLGASASVRQIYLLR